MASQQDIRRRIRSVRNTRKITKAMELVSGAKLRKAQQRIERLRPFADAMHDLIAEAAGRARVARQPLLQRREPQRTGVLVCTGDRGLAGAFNASVLRRSLDEGRRLRGEGQELVWYAVGKRGAGSLRFRGIDLVEAWAGFTDSPVYPDAEQIANRLITDYVEERVDRVVMIYNHFDSPLQQTVYVEQVLPVPIDDIEELSAREIALQGTLLFEPDEEEMLGTLLPTAVETAVFRALLESTASEHGARMTAMRTASENAGELIEDLTLEMNRARPAEITQEIREVVAGADALTQ